MTYWKTFDTTNFDRFFVGADRIAESLRKNAEWIANNAATSYPPFNLKKTDENKYVIELAVAGFARQDIEMTLEDNKLVIKGKTVTDTGETDEVAEYLHKGIANRCFSRQFTLADNVEIHNAELLNGLLKVYLEHVIPEANKPKKIEIKEVETKVKSNG